MRPNVYLYQNDFYKVGNCSNSMGVEKNFQLTMTFSIVFVLGRQRPTSDVENDCLKKNESFKMGL